MVELQELVLRFAANMHFGEEGLAMYDFQYCGKAPCTKDLAYCLICASDAASGGEAEDEFLQFYHGELSGRLQAQGIAGEAPTLQQLMDSYAVASCDLARWMCGWGW